jgi:hypothetical protein
MEIKRIYEIFEKAIADYHIKDELVDSFNNPFELDSLDAILYHKSFVDTIQWHCEDEVRNPVLEAEKVRYFKNKIDKLNQERTNLVEQIDDILYTKFKDIKPQSINRLVTESPAWAIDRLSILALKIYHMRIEAHRQDSSEINKINYTQKLALLETQRADLIEAIDNLIIELELGTSVYKLYRQVKMYNDADLNPILRKNK